MNQAKISVIIPVYNVEPYLRQCLDSVVNQSLKELEIICVNDGSTDGSLTILQEYAAADARVIIIDKKNGGQGLARNIAIQQATGEYLGFVDSDDWIDTEMYQELYNAAKKFDSDVTLCEFQHYNQEEKVFLRPDWIKIPVDQKFNDTVFSWTDIAEVGFLINSSPWNKIFKREFVQRLNIQYAIGVHYQDVLFVFYSLIYAQKINLVRKVLYTYRNSRPGSTTSDIGKRQFDIFTVLDQLQQVVERSKKYEHIKKAFIDYKFGQYLYHFDRIDKRYRNAFWRQIRSAANGLDQESRVELFEHYKELEPKLKYGLMLYPLYQMEQKFEYFLYRHKVVEKFKIYFKQVFLLIFKPIKSIK